MSVRIFPAAENRLLNIWDYTAETWGETQADKYVRGLVEAAERACKARYSWRVVPDENLNEVFFIHHQHHFIFFRELSKGMLGIISILHESMDIPSRLKEDSGHAEME